MAGRARWEGESARKQVKRQKKREKHRNRPLPGFRTAACFDGYFSRFFHTDARISFRTSMASRLLYPYRLLKSSSSVWS